MRVTEAEIKAINSVLARHGYRSETMARECAEAAAAARECERHLPARDGWPGPQARA